MSQICATLFWVRNRLYTLSHKVSIFGNFNLFTDLQIYAGPPKAPIIPFMENLSLQVYPSPILKKKMPEVEEISSSLEAPVRQMFDIMYANNGIGLAANQAGWNVRVVVMNLSGDPERPDEELVLINPEVMEKSKKTYMDEEGCLSFPEVKAQVQRHEEVTFKALDLDGRELVYHADELFARCIQHELDHLNGVTFVERLLPGQRAKVAGRIKELEAAWSPSS